MNWKAATDAQILQIVYHEPRVSLSTIQQAAEEYQRRHGQKSKWWRTEGEQRQ